jgi:hypothetical protein
VAIHNAIRSALRLILGGDISRAALCCAPSVNSELGYDLCHGEGSMIPKLGLTILLLLASASQSSAKDLALHVCGTIVQANMKQPSSYKVTDVIKKRGSKGGAASYYRLTFDAMNTFGAVLSYNAECLFDYDEGRNSFWLIAVLIDGSALPKDYVRSASYELGAGFIPADRTELEVPQ